MFLALLAALILKHERLSVYTLCNHFLLQNMHTLIQYLDNIYNFIKINLFD